MRVPPQRNSPSRKMATANGNWFLAVAEPPTTRVDGPGAVPVGGSVGAGTGVEVAGAGAEVVGAGAEVAGVEVDVVPSWAEAGAARAIGAARQAAAMNGIRVLRTRAR